VKRNWLAPCAVVALALGSLAAASRARGEVGLGRSDFRAEEGPARVARGSACGSATGGRIVSAALLADELLLDLLPRERLAGVSYVVDWERSTPAFGRFPASIPRVSGASEELLLLAPSAVVVSDYTSGMTEAQLASAGVCVLRLRAPRTFDDLVAQTEELGAATRTEQAASDVTLSIRQRLAALDALPKAVGRRKRALLVQDPYAYGPRTLQDDCLRHAGLENALEPGKFSATPMLGIEQLVSLDPELVFLATDTEAPRPLRPERRPHGAGWAHLGALERGAAFEIPAAWMASISHHALDACESYARLARSSP
jgi:ABC-type Fe3+-hydroxamate transport system substrate-binding protein